MRITRQIKTDIVKSISAIHDVCFTLLLPCHVILKLLPYVAVALIAESLFLSESKINLRGGRSYVHGRGDGRRLRPWKREYR